MHLADPCPQPSSSGSRIPRTAPLDGIRAASDLLRTNRTTERPPVAPAAALTAPLPEVAGYELVRERGRGGMGVVYEARHLSLRRTVALKMIRTLFADPDHIVRFHREAEAFARMQHPHIVQVYEVGSHHHPLSPCGAYPLQDPRVPRLNQSCSTMGRRVALVARDRLGQLPTVLHLWVDRRQLRPRRRGDAEVKAASVLPRGAR